jgi:hypothetical protein
MQLLDVLASATVKAFSQSPVVFVQGGGATVAGLENSDTYWNSMAYIMSQFPSVAEHGIMSYITFSPNTTPAPGPEILASFIDFFSYAVRAGTTESIFHSIEFSFW